MFKLGNRSKKNLRNVHPDLVDVVERAIQITRQDFSVHSGARTSEEQYKLYQQGRTKPGPIVTSKDGYKHKSNHQTKMDGYGYSVDLVPYVNGGLQWDWSKIYFIASAMSKAAEELNVKIKWGGNWYETMDQYGHEVSDVKQAVERYKKDHPGPDFIDGPHFELEK